MFGGVGRNGGGQQPPVRLLGIDPGLRHTGWGVIDVSGNRLTHVADGAVHSDGDCPLPERLCQIYDALTEVLELYNPDEAAVEETFVNSNAVSTLKLGQARAVALLVPARAGLAVAEYANNMVKKAVVGQGRADKAQVQTMVRMLLPGCTISTADAADALAVAICHAHHRASWTVWRRGAVQAPDPLLPPAHAQTKFALTRQADQRSAESGEKVGMRGFGAAERISEALPPHPNPLPGGERGQAVRASMAQEAKRKPSDLETDRARILRRDSTDVEKIVWQRLRNGQLGAKFCRQEPILGYVADFVSHDHRLIVELDGGQHAEQRLAHDERRSRVLEQAGFRVLRFWNTEVIDNLDGVLETIRVRLEETSVLRSQPMGKEGNG